MSRRHSVPLNDYYVYVLFRDNGEPFYVGKGRRRRWLAHERDAVCSYRKASFRTRIIRKMFADGWTEIPKVKLAEGLTDKIASTYEIAFIAAIGRYPDGPLANLTDGGEGLVNPSEEIRAKLRSHQLGVPMSAKNRAALAAAHLGASLDAEHRAKISASLLGHPMSEETRLKISQSKTGAPGKPHTPEAKAKIGNAQRGKIVTEQSRDKMRAAKLGGKLSDEHKAKIGTSLLGRVCSDETRAKISAAHRARTSCLRKIS